MRKWADEDREGFGIFALKVAWAEGWQCATGKFRVERASDELKRRLRPKSGDRRRDNFDADWLLLALDHCRKRGEVIDIFVERMVRAEQRERVEDAKRKSEPSRVRRTG